MNRTTRTIDRQNRRQVSQRSRVWMTLLASGVAAALAAPVLAAPPAGSQGAGKPCPQGTTTTPTGTTVTTTTPGVTVTPGGVNRTGNGTTVVNNGNVAPTGLPATRPTVSIPTIDTKSVDTAKSDLAAARLELAKSASALANVARRIAKEQEASSELREAITAVTSAKATYDSLATPILNSLAKQPGYQAAMAKQANAELAVAELSGNRNAEPADRINAAKASLTAKNEVAKLQANALSSNPAVVSAKADWLSAAEALSNLRQQNAEAVKKDADWLSAKEKVDSAKSAVTVAERKLADAQTDLNQQQSARAAALAEQKKLDRQFAQQASRPR